MRGTFILAACLALACGAAQAASGYAVGHESPSGAGVANAGGAAAAQDASTIWANPAGMTRLDSEAVVGLHLIVPHIDFENRGSVLFNGAPVPGGEGGNGGYPVGVPNLYGVWSVSPALKLGLGINAPYGLVTDYEPDYVGRYSEVTTNLKTFNVNPSAALKLGGGWSLGAGLDLGYADAKLLQAIDFGSACAAALGAGACAGGFGLVPGLSDGDGKVEGHDFGYGFNLGVLYEPTPNTRFGAQYRSKLDSELDLDARFNVAANARAFLAAAGSPAAFTDSGATTKLTIPETASVSAYHELDDRWAIMADVTWTRWTRFDELRIHFDNPQTPTKVLTTDWHDVFRYSGGVAYRWSEGVTLRGGLAFDESPIPTRNRGPGIPDSDRWVVAAGFGWQITPRATLDAAYQHLFFRDGETARVSTTGSVMIGEFQNDVDIFTAGLRWRF
jgi:long-chain fatty acid transport protein